MVFEAKVLDICGLSSDLMPRVNRSLDKKREDVRLSRDSWVYFFFSLRTFRLKFCFRVRSGPDQRRSARSEATQPADTPYTAQ